MSLFSIQRKTVIVTLFMLVVIVVMAVLQYRAVVSYRSIGQLRVLASDIESNVLTLRRNEKDFLARKDDQYRQRFLENYRLIQANVMGLRSGLQETDVDNAKISELSKILESYKNIFIALAQLQEEIGLSHEDGLYGRLRVAIHRVEDILTSLRQGHLIKDMLMLRRQEKDFMLRKDTEYVDKFAEDMSVMRSDLSQAYLDPLIKNEVSAALSAYETDFQALVSATQKMGFSSNDGLHGEMRQRIHEGERILDELRQDVLGLESRAGNHMINQMIALAVVLTLFLSMLIRL